MNENQEKEIDLIKLGKDLLHKAWIIVLVAVVAGAVGFLHGESGKTSYEAVNMMQVDVGFKYKMDEKSAPEIRSDATATQRLINTYIAVLNSKTTLDLVIKDAGLPYSYEDFKNKVTITAEQTPDTGILNIKVTDDNKKEAELVAQSVVNVLKKDFSDILEGGTVKISSFSNVATKTEGKNDKGKSALTAALIGAVLACVVIAIAFICSKKVRDTDDLTQDYSYPVLAVIPGAPAKSKGNDANGKNIGKGE